MSLSDTVVKLIGIVLAVVGLGILLSVVGINFLGIALGGPVWLSLVVGVIFMGAGIYIIKGGNFTL